MNETIGVRLKLAVDCQGCKHAIPVNGVGDSIQCPRCQEVNPLDWVRLLNLGNPACTAFKRAIQLGDGEKDTGAFSTIHLELERQAPTCSGCGSELALAAIEEAVAAGGVVRCSCGAPTPVREAPPPLVEICGFARYLLDEHWVEEGPSAEEGSTAAIRCAECGAPLSVDGRERTVRCAFCSGTTYLFDALWDRLHPPRKIEPFYVLLIPRSNLEQMYRWRMADPLADAQDPNTGADELAILAAMGDLEVRRAVARHPQAGLGLLSQLAADDHASVRDAAVEHSAATEATQAALVAKLDELSRHEKLPHYRADVAADPRLPQEAMQRLARDSAAVVRESLVRNPEIPVELLARLGTDDHASVRAAVAAHPETPKELLVTLYRDSNREVACAAKDNRNTPRSWWRKLVG